MFLIRQSKPEDVSTLLKLARTVYFINLPPNESLIAGKIEQSTQTFRQLAGGAQAARNAKSPGAPAASPKPGSSQPKRSRRSNPDTALYDTESDLYMFTIVDPEGGGVIGTSQIRAHMGGPGQPNWAFKVTEKKFHSARLRFGTTHTVGQLYGDETGPSEIGGLILDPGFRGHKLRPGRFLSFVRFHLMGLHPAKFSDRVLAEMMAPVSSEGDNLFWDHFGRKFIPVKYAEADRFCQHNRAFISELLPKDEIYLTLFPLEVQNLIGVVANETQPARRLLENLGFRFRNFIDPFDGGPHLDAIAKDIPLVAQTQPVHFGKSIAADRGSQQAMISTLTPEGEFRAVETYCDIDGDEVRVPQQAMDLLQAQTGMACGITELKAFGDSKAEAPSEAAPAGSKRPKGKKTTKTSSSSSSSKATNTTKSRSSKRSAS